MNRYQVVEVIKDGITSHWEVELINSCDRFTVWDMLLDEKEYKNKDDACTICDRLNKPPPIIFRKVVYPCPK